MLVFFCLILDDLKWSRGPRGIILHAIHFHSVVKNKCYFVQSSYYTPATDDRKFTQKSHPTKMTENCCPAAKHEGNWVTWNLNFECNLDASVNGGIYRSRTLLRLVSLYHFSEFLWQFMHGNHLKMIVWIDRVLKRKCCFQMYLD